MTSDEWATARDELVDACRAVGMPAEFGLALARYLGSPASMGRMSAYLLGVRPRSLEEAADEAVSLEEERERWAREERSGQAAAAYTAWLNRPDRPPEDEDDPR